MAEVTVIWIMLGIQIDSTFFGVYQNHKFYPNFEIAFL